ncbi:ABC transporter substrate-binding protein [Falsirhodobacter sp. 20TX0035]|uniref:ABC transporter substrate-binding protein n=1 Tax=Falsirhodobacter sp. 20TX0035 TaxID=3022019 RepID=UPI0023314B50|nr:ABC transporter substrate-binding protein [Falsirhodobacter sp. 20TX0035]MDB6452334.1 ABC transporter substrate-binding protein [Falsirhodobacter sp. 20TX0035]
MNLRTRLLAGAACLAAAPSLAATPDNALVMAWNIDAISTFDPAQIGEVVTSELMDNICDPLVNFAPEEESRVIPGFAESWDVSEDGKTLTFHLHQRATFPSGNPVTAEDTVWSLKRAISLGFGNASALTDYGFTTENMDTRITAPDDHTVVLTFETAYPTNLLLQAVGADGISATLDRKTILANEMNGDLGNAWLNAHTACVGPYSLVQWNQGEGVVLQANKEYYGDAPKIPRILIRHVAETGTQRLLVEQGDVDVARDLTPDDLAALDDTVGIEIVSALKPQLIFNTMNLSRPPFDNEKVRLAMKYLIDYQGLGDTVMQYLGKPWNSFAQSGAWGALEGEEGTPFTLDLEKAKALITEAGYPDGFETTLLIGSLPWSSPLGQHLQQNAAKIGITLNIEQMANAQLFARARARDFDSIIMAWQTNIPDAHGNASRLVMNPDNSDEAKLTQYPAWRAHYQDVGYNERVEAAVSETDEAKRREMYRTLQQDWMQTGEMAVMFQTYNVAAIRDTVKDWTWNGFRTYYPMVSK